MALAEPPVCSICDHPMQKLKRLTKNKYDSIWVCTYKRPRAKFPCDGDVFDIAAKINRPKS